MSGLFEDLQLLSERLDALWDMYDTSLSIERPREERQAMVVEAPHSTLWPLRLPAGLRFMPPIPEMHIRADSRHRFVNRQVCHQTDLAGVGAGADLPLPEGLSFWQPTDAARGLLFVARHDLHALFGKELERPIASRLPASDDDILHGVYTLFEWVGQPRVLYKDAMALLNPVYRGLTRLCEEYAWMASRLYGITPHAFRRSARVTITRVRAGFGLPLSLPAFERFNQGPVLTVCLGPPSSTWDVVPSMAPEAPSMRLAHPEGTLHVADGHARLLHSFGEPLGCSPDQPRYRLTFYLGMQGARVREPVTPLGAPVLGTPLVRANLVATREHPDYASRPHVHTTAVEETVYALHERLVAFESRAAVLGHAQTFTAAHQRCPTSGENCSSSMLLE